MVTGDGAPTRDSTLEDLTDRPARRGTHRVAVSLLVVLVLAGVSGLLGPRTAEVSEAAEGYRLHVTYPSVVRAGVATPLRLEVTREEGFDGPVELGVCSDWFDEVDFHAWHPTPASEVGEPGRTLLELDPPRGGSLVVTLDAHEEPGHLWGSRECTIEVLEAGLGVVSASFTTWRMP